MAMIRMWEMKMLWARSHPIFAWRTGQCKWMRIRRVGNIAHKHTAHFQWKWRKINIPNNECLLRTYILCMKANTHRHWCVSLCTIWYVAGSVLFWPLIQSHIVCSVIVFFFYIRLFLWLWHVVVCLWPGSNSMCAWNGLEQTRFGQTCSQLFFVRPFLLLRLSCSNLSLTFIIIIICFSIYPSHLVYIHATHRPLEVFACLPIDH